MNLSVVLKRSGASKSDLARWAGVTPQAVNRWTHVPPRYCAAVEIGSGGRVTVEDMAPGLTWYRDRTGKPRGYLAEPELLPVPPPPSQLATTAELDAAVDQASE